MENDARYERASQQSYNDNLMITIICGSKSAKLRLHSLLVTMSFNLKHAKSSLSRQTLLQTQRDQLFRPTKDAIVHYISCGDRAMENLVLGEVISEGRVGPESKNVCSGF